MARRKASIGRATNELRKDSQIVGLTDRVYPVNGTSVVFREILVQGDLSGELDYNGHRLKVKSIGTVSGLKVDMKGARGPVWEEVECEIV